MAILVLDKKNITVLLVSDTYPYPPVDGRKVRNYNLYKNIDSVFRCTWLIFGPPGTNKDYNELCSRLGESCEQIKFVPESSIKEVSLDIGPIQKIFFPPKISVGPPLYSDMMEQAVTNEIKSRRYDIIVFSGYEMYIYADKNLVQDVPCVVDIIDSLSVWFWNKFSQETNILDKIKSFFHYIWSVRFEKIHFSDLKNMILVSQVDATVVKRHCPQSNVRTITNGVDTRYFKQDTSIKRTPNSLLFTGVMDYPPNNDAMVYFIKHVLSIIAEKNDIILMIAGPNPSAELVSLAQGNPHVELLGYVDDIRTAFDKAEVYVSPLLSGAGMKNKILEAWAMSKPVVATSLSCAGLRVQDGNNIVLADNAADFADAVCRLLSDADVRNRLAEGGRRTVEKYYSWRSKAKELEDFLIDAIHEFKATNKSS